MKKLNFSYNYSMVSDSTLFKTAKKLNNELKCMDKASKLKYEDPRASINLPFDNKSLKDVKSMIKQKLALRPQYLIVVGIGGSNLATKAVQEAVYGRHYNLQNPNIKVLYADTVDSDLIANMQKIIEPVLKKGGNVIINGVSKSGSTTETIANFEILVNLVKKYKKNYHKYVVVTTDKDSNLWYFANDHKFDVLEVPAKVGGRYSVFSSVGLFPLGLIGIDIKKFLKGAAYMRNLCMKNNNPAMVSAALTFIHYKKGKNIHDIFLFSPDLESIGKWYRQLMGESIGKRFNIKDKRVDIGITPTVSIGSTDLHSIAQLYLGGPYDKFITFVTTDKNNSNVKIPNIEEYSKLVDKLQGRPLLEIMDAIYEGVKIAFTKRKRPFTEIVLPDKSEYSLGQFLQFKMMEMMYLGALLEVNPFDQPNVEDYKVETRRLLAR